MPVVAEYVWVDGTKPSASVRSKTRIIRDDNLLPSDQVQNMDSVNLNCFPEWSADGSSTNQAAGKDSDILLRPVRAIRDPYRKGGYMVLTEVFTGNGEVHPTNHRAELRRVLDAGAGEQKPLFGFEQEYTFMKKNGTPLGFPEGGFPGPQGPYYCAVGTNNIAGREVYEEFLQKALEADISLTGTNWEVMPGQAEFQICDDALKATDHIWLSRYLLQRAGENHKVDVSFDAKPIKGDWNGAGMHTNFSTKAMREDGGAEAIEKACKLMSTKVNEHLAVYGDNYEARLTGAHETCSYKDFRWGTADRTASIRIPRIVAETGKGYLEDRRPNANANPYEIASRMLKTVCEID